MPPHDSYRLDIPFHVVTVKVGIVPAADFAFVMEVTNGVLNMHLGYSLEEAEKQAAGLTASIAAIRKAQEEDAFHAAPVEGRA